MLHVKIILFLKAGIAIKVRKFTKLAFFKAENAYRVKNLQNLIDFFFCNKESSKGGRRKKKILSRIYYL